MKIVDKPLRAAIVNAFITMTFAGWASAQEVAVEVSPDITISLSGTLTSDDDVVQFDGMNFSLVFDGTVEGVSAALDIDALHFSPEFGSYYFSFDTSGKIDGEVFSDEDLVRFNPKLASWSLVYDGSNRHVDWVAGDLDAAFVTFLAGYNFGNGFETL